MNDLVRPNMEIEPALAHLSQRRVERDVVISNQSTARLWPRLSNHPLDFNYNPSTMSGAVPLGLGIAMARPQAHVIVLSGDGSLLMSLGCLATVMASRVKNLSILLMDNGMYEVTGGQKTAARGTPLDFAAIATATGFPSVASFDDLDRWRSESDSFFSSDGPRFAVLRVGRTPKHVFSDTHPPVSQRMNQFCNALNDVMAT